MRFVAAFALTLALSSCAANTPPPNLTPVAQKAWQGTRAIKALDQLRDIVIDGNALNPPVFTTAATGKVVAFHKSAITIIHAAPGGWQMTVQTSLTELVKDLPAADRQQVAPYVALAKTILAEVNQ